MRNIPFNMSRKGKMPFLRFESIRIQHISGRQRSRQGS